MRCFVVFETDVPSEEVSESLDLVTAAWHKAKLACARSESPCGYDVNVKFVYEGDTYYALRVL